MTPYADFTYFAVLLYVGLPTLMLGLMGRLSRWWFLTVTVIMLAVQYGGVARVGPFTAVREIWILLGYALVQVAIAKSFHLARARGGGRRLIYGAVGFAVLPLAVAKFVPLVAPASHVGFLGISYVTFRSLDVIIGIQDRLIPSLPTSQLLAYLFFFPAVSSGPIDRYRRFADDWKRRRSRPEFLRDVDAAVHRIFTGFLYKFIIAALLKRYWLDPAGASAGLTGLVSYMYAYTFYLFFDFAGYSAFAIGVSYLFGIHTPENFNRPFLAPNIRDFWNRWHISLSWWLRDHVYMRFVWAVGKGRWFKNKYVASHIGFLLSMGLMGLWHGTAWYFLLYGVYHAILLVGHDILSRWNQRRRFWGEGPLWQAAGVLLTFNLVCFGFLLFSGRLEARLLEPNLKGTIETADCRMISGWVVDDNRPDDLLAVDLYEGDTWLATVRATQLRKDLAEQWGTLGRHGFTYALADRLRDGKFHSIHGKVSGTDTYLFDSPATIACGDPHVTVEGVHGRTHCGAVAGWVWDSGQPDTPIDVDIYDGDTLLATVPADAYRAGLEWWKGKGYHGFDYALPPSVRDGRPHVIRTTVAGTEIPLQGTPQSIACNGDVDPMQGFDGVLEPADSATVVGWAYDRHDPDRPVDVDLYDGEELLATVRADQFRQDLHRAGLAGRHGFTYSIPAGLRDGRPLLIAARISGTEVALKGSPTSIGLPGNGH